MIAFAIKQVRRYKFVVGEKEGREQMIALNKLLRREPVPQPCTCPTDHGWH